MMKSRWIVALAALPLGACAATLAERPAAMAPVDVTIIAINDFHGNLEPPRQYVNAPNGAGGMDRVPAGGVAYLASAISQLRSANPNNIVVSAGDMIGASPFISSLFLDEPTILAMNMIGVDFNAVGNHEFDRGRAELLRMQRGGCDQHTVRAPCQVDAAFPGAQFNFLAANTLTENGTPLFPAYGIRTFGDGASAVSVGFIGMTLRETGSLVTPAGVAGLTFSDEAETANALVPVLRAQGVDVIIVLIHQGLLTRNSYNDQNCSGLEGELLEILDRLDPTITAVVSGHTHNAYVCDYGRINPSRPFLVTSAGLYGTLVTNIQLSIRPDTGAVISRSADNHIVQGAAFSGSRGDVPLVDRLPRYAADGPIAALVERYAIASRNQAQRAVGRLAGPALRQGNSSGESVLGNLIADAQLAATQDPTAGGAQIAFMNAGGVRADLLPDATGQVSFGSIYAVQPFANGLVVKTMTGTQIRALLEQQFTVSDPRPLAVSQGFSYAYDRSRAPGERILAMRLNGVEIAADATYRVTMSSFLGSGGDGYTVFAQGVAPTLGMQDIEALERHLSGTGTRTLPALGRLDDQTPPTP